MLSWRRHPTYGDLVIVVAVLIALWGATHPEDATNLIRWIIGAVVGVTALVLLAVLIRRWRGLQPLRRGLQPLVKQQPPYPRPGSGWEPSPGLALPPGPQRSEARPRDGAAQADEPPARWSLQVLQELEWKRFEELCAAYFEAVGRVVVRSAQGADEGIDFYLYGQRGRSARALIGVRCKASSSSRVGVKAIGELLESMLHTGCPNGLFLTSAAYTPDAVQFARGKPIELIDAGRMLSLIGALPEATQAALLAMATHGDYRTPSCPSCGTKLVERAARQGNGLAGSVWACTNHPTCRTTIRERA